MINFSRERSESHENVAIADKGFCFQYHSDSTSCWKIIFFGIVLAFIKDTFGTGRFLLLHYPQDCITSLAQVKDSSGSTNVLRYHSHLLSHRRKKKEHTLDIFFDVLSLFDNWQDFLL